MTELQARWMQQVQDYYRDQYPRSMQAKVAEILPHGQAALKALFETLILNVSAQYRTVPDVAAIRTALQEVREGYPELTQPVAPAGLIEDKHGGIPIEVLHEYGQHLADMMISGDESWRTDGYHKRWLQARGFTAE